MKVLGNIKSLAQCLFSGAQNDIRVIDDAAVVWQETGKIVWMGAVADLPAGYAAAEFVDAKGGFVIPGLVDCHTHLAFGGWRADEFEQRILGKSYLDIARAGGGIAQTVRLTRAASVEELTDRCLAFLKKISALGVTTIECKSGYGLTEVDELKTLEIYQRLQEKQPVDIVSTFLGAHIVPPEYSNNRSAYIDLLVQRLIPLIGQKGLANFCDVFVEETAYSIEEARMILNTGKQHGLQPKLHVDQLSDGGGAELAVEVNAISADHLEFISESGIRRMADSDVVAVTLPLASLYTRQPPLMARKLIDAGIPVAVATDFNPGSAPSYHLHFAMHLACVLNGMSPAEVLKGATIYAAKALGLQNSVGSLEVGKQADIAVIAAEGINDWMYHFREETCMMTIKNGAII